MLVIQRACTRLRMLSLLSVANRTKTELQRLKQRDAIEQARHMHEHVPGTGSHQQLLAKFERRICDACPCAYPCACARAYTCTCAYRQLHAKLERRICDACGCASPCACACPRAYTCACAYRQLLAKLKRRMGFELLLSTQLHVQAFSVGEKLLLRGF